LGDKWLTYSVSLIFHMAAMAIFENGRTLPFLCICGTEQVFLTLCTKIHQNQAMNG
jgi:hypothetical protein